MSTLSCLKKMSDSEIRRWLRLAERKNLSILVTALVGADQAVLDCVARNLSERAESELFGELEKQRKLRISPLEIHNCARKLEALI